MSLDNRAFRLGRKFGDSLQGALLKCEEQHKCPPAVQACEPQEDGSPMKPGAEAHAKPLNCQHRCGIGNACCRPSVRHYVISRCCHCARYGTAHVSVAVPSITSSHSYHLRLFVNCLAPQEAREDCGNDLSISSTRSTTKSKRSTLPSDASQNHIT